LKLLVHRLSHQQHQNWHQAFLGSIGGPCRAPILSPCYRYGQEKGEFSGVVLLSQRCMKSPTSWLSSNGGFKLKSTTAEDAGDTGPLRSRTAVLSNDTAKPHALVASYHANSYHVLLVLSYSCSSLGCPCITRHQCISLSHTHTAFILLCFLFIHFRIHSSS
jgi:hypothetical protein